MGLQWVASGERDRISFFAGRRMPPVVVVAREAVVTLPLLVKDELALRYWAPLRLFKMNHDEWPFKVAPVSDKLLTPGFLAGCSCTDDSLYGSIV